MPGDTYAAILPCKPIQKKLDISLGIGYRWTGVGAPAVENPGDSNGFHSGGRVFAASEIALIREVVTTCGGLSRKELANTISELVG
jgi:hypothetical protein